ncbi:MAG: thioredoxin family protein [Epsilonproteobacteria bacterium]|nr:thioredoxin family protein [Campylobacterota bacterium]
MRLIYIFFIVVLFGASAYSESDKNTVLNSISSPNDTMQNIAGLSWHTQIDKALNNAQKSHKNLIVMVGEESCRWCKKMKERTLIDPRIQNKLSNYVLVSVKRSDKKAVAHVPEFDGKIPSFFFIEKNGEVYDSVVGYYKADDFLRYINEIEEL